MTKRQTIALGRKTFKEYVKIIMNGPETIDSIHKASLHKEEVRKSKCKTPQEKAWFDIGFIYQTEKRKKEFLIWNKGFWDGVESTKYDGIDLSSEPKIPQA